MPFIQLIMFYNSISILFNTYQLFQFSFSDTWEYMCLWNIKTQNELF
jgi:hypothetical protein